MVLAIIGVGMNIVSADPPAPGGYLGHTDQAKFGQLPGDIQAILIDEFLPTLDTYGFDERSKADFLSAVVNEEYKVRVLGRERDVAASGYNSNLLPGGKCYLTGPFFWYNESNATSYSSVSCDYQQDSVTSTSMIAFHGTNPIGVANHRLHASSSWSLAVDVYQSGLWNICGGFATTPDSDPARDFAEPPRDRVCEQGHRTP